jgi:PAS domain S-box-containing protein
MIEHPENQRSILIIDDRPATVEVLNTILVGRGYSVQSAMDGGQGLSAALAATPDLIIMAASSPELDGLALCKQLKAHSSTSSIPVILVDPVDRAQAFAAGGADYLVSPLIAEEVVARVTAHAEMRVIQEALRNSEKRLEFAATELRMVEAQRKAIQDALQEAEAKGIDLIENLTDVIYILDRDGALGYASPAVEGLLGYRAAELTGLRPEGFVHKQDLPRLEENLARVLAGGRSADEYRLLTKSGDVRWVRTSSQPYYEDGRVSGIQGVLVDITERVLAEEGQRQALAEALKVTQALRESEERWRSLTEYSPDYIMLLDRGARILFVNHTLPEISREQVIGVSFHDFALEEYRPVVQACFDRVLNSGEPDSFESVYVDPDGRRRTFESLVGPVLRSGEVWGLTVRSTDITERKEVAEALDRLSHELGERVKELKCLYSISALATRLDLSLEEILTGTVALIPPGFLHPEATGAQILWEGQEFRTQNFKETPWILDADLVVHGHLVGTLKVCYLQAGIDGAESPFFPHEWDLVEAIAGRLVSTAERIEVEERLRQQNEFLVHVLESLTHPFYVIDPYDYTIHIANSAAQAQTLSGATACYALTHGRSKPCDMTDHPCPLEEIKRTKKPVMVEHVHYDAEGNLKNVEVHGYPLCDSDGNLIRVIEYSLDVTERKQAEAGQRKALAEALQATDALRQSEERYRQLLDALQEGIWVLDVDAKTTFVNPRMAEMLGYTVEEMQGQHLFSFMDERGIEISTGNLQRREEGIKEQHDFEFLRKDGSRLFALLEASPIYDDDGNYAGSLAGIQDITERRRAQEALQRSENLLKETQRLARLGGWELYPDTQQVRWTEEVFAIHEVPLDFEPSLETALAFYPAKDRQLLEDAIRLAIERGETWDLELQFQTATGRRLWVRAIGKAECQDGRVVKLSGTFQDVSERKQAEQALRAAKEEAEWARRQERERRHEADRRRRIAESLIDVLASLNSSQPLGQVLKQIAMQAAQSLDNQSVAIYRLASMDGMLALQAAEGFPEAWIQEAAHLPCHEAIGQALASGQSLAVSDLAADVGSGQLSEVPGVGPYRSLLAAPIVVNGVVYGGMVLYHTLPRAFSDEEVDLIGLFSDQAALAIGNAWLREQAEIAGASAERSRLARDLHDSVTQALFSASLVADVLPQIWERDQDQALQGVAELRRLTRAALSEMRTMLLELRPTALLETDLDDLLGQLTEAITSRVQLQVTLDVQDIPTLPPEVHVTFYRVAQEALNNVVKHGAASQLVVSLRASPPLLPQLRDQWQGQVILHVSDDGRGFDPCAGAQDHLGLEIMLERASSVGAVLTIDSQPGRGTQVSLVWQAGQPSPAGGRLARDGAPPALKGV